MVMGVCAPSASAIGGEVVFDAIVVPFSFMVALASLVFGRTVMEAVELLTLRV